MPFSLDYMTCTVPCYFFGRPPVAVSSNSFIDSRACLQVVNNLPGLSWIGGAEAAKVWKRNLPSTILHSRHLPSRLS